MIDSAARRVLVRAPNWLGDIVMALPAIGALRAAFDQARLVVAAPAGLAEVFRFAAGVDEVVGLERGSAWSLMRGSDPEVVALRGAHCDVGVLLPNSLRSALALVRAGVPERWGYAAEGRRPFLTRAVSRRIPRASPHHADYYRALVGALVPEAVPPDRVPLRATDYARRRARRLLESRGVDRWTSLVAVAPGAAFGHAKRWLPSRVADVIGRLVRERSATIVLVGAASDRDSGIAVEEALRATPSPGPGRSAPVNLIGQMSIVELVGLLAACRVMLANDSGAMHLAAALDVPVTAVFGPTDERVTAPLGPNEVVRAAVWCAPCGLRECPIDHRCMKRVSVDEVFASMTRQLDRRGSA